LALTLTLPLGAAGQTPSPPRAQFRVGTAVVLLDVLVRDKSGRAIRDISQGEVQVLENGQPCEISSFRRVEVSSPASGDAPSGAAAPAATPRGSRLTSGNFVSLVFAPLATEDRAAATRAATEFIGRFLTGGSREQVAVFTVGRTLDVVQGFTTNGQAVADAVSSALSRSRREKSETKEAIRAAHEADQAAGSAVAPAVDLGDASSASRERVIADPSDARFREAVAKMLRATDDAQRWQQGSDTLRPLFALMSAQASLPGRKTVLFFSPGLDVPEPLQDLYRSTVSAANRANVSVYAVDVRGLRTQSDAAVVADVLQQSTGRARLQLQAASSEPRDLTALDTTLSALHLNPQLALADFAADTGGFLLANSNDFRAGMDRVASDLTGYYEIVYVPAKTEYDGTFRKIDVRVGRKNVVVQTRSGYFARPLPDQEIRPSLQPLMAALTAATVADGAAPRGNAVGAPASHKAAVIRLADAGSFPELLALVDVPKASLALAGAPAAGAGAVLGVVRDARGLIVATLSYEGSADEGQVSAPSANIVFGRTMRLAPGRYVLETAVQDAATGEIATRRTSFEVPEPQPGPTLGSVTVARTVPSGARAELVSLRAGSLSAVPNMGQPFPQGTPEIGVFFTASTGSGSEPPRLTIEYRKDDEVFARDVPTVPPADATGRMSFLGRIPAAALAPGRYEVWVRFAEGADEVSEATSFVIAPRPPGAAVASDGPTTQRRLKDRKAPDVPLATILDRAGEYVTRYAESFRYVVAEELYRQWLVDAVTGRTTTRTLRSDLVFVSVPGSLPWGTFRDVFEVDGHILADREGRLAKVFGKPSPDVVRQAQEILKESSRYNLGFAYRNVNSPTLGMLLLLLDNQRRLEFERKGERTISGVRCVEVAFRELRDATVVRDQWGGDVHSHGHFWIDATRGAVFRTEVEYDLASNSAEDPEDRKTGSVATEYRRESWIDVLVPDSMKELYRLGPTRIEGTARYSKYRQFSVTTNETATLPPKP
jgi:VWFA-related protein